MSTPPHTAPLNELQTGSERVKVLCVREQSDLEKQGKELGTHTTELEVGGDGDGVAAILLAAAAMCPNLVMLKVMASCPFSCEAIARVAQNCPALKILRVHHTKGDFENVLLDVACARPSLEELEMLGCDDLTDLAIVRVMPLLPGLARLKVPLCAALTDSSIIAAARHCHAIKVLNVGGCYKLTNASIMEVARNCPGLTELDVNNCRRLGDASIVEVARNCRDLRKLRVCDTLFTDEAFKAVGEYSHKLTRLTMIQCIYVTDETVRALKKCKKLARVVYANCLNIKHGVSPKLRQKWSRGA